MKITRNVILDLLPMYLSGEVSEDTRNLVDEYLETDPELDRIVKDPASTGLPEPDPATLTKEDKMEAYKEAKHELWKRTITIAAVLAFSLVGLGVIALVLAFFRMSSAF